MPERQRLLSPQAPEPHAVRPRQIVWNCTFRNMTLLLMVEAHRRRTGNHLRNSAGSCSGVAQYNVGKLVVNSSSR